MITTHATVLKLEPRQSSELPENMKCELAAGRYIKVRVIDLVLKHHVVELGESIRECPAFEKGTAVYAYADHVQIGAVQPPRVPSPIPVPTPPAPPTEPPAEGVILIAIQDTYFKATTAGAGELADSLKCLVPRKAELNVQILGKEDNHHRVLVLKSIPGCEGLGDEGKVGFFYSLQVKQKSNVIIP